MCSWEGFLYVVMTYFGFGIETLQEKKIYALFDMSVESAAEI